LIFLIIDSLITLLLHNLKNVYHITIFQKSENYKKNVILINF